MNLSSKRRRVLVTGAAGLLGGRLAALLAADTDVVAAVRTSMAPPGLPVVTLDLLDEASLDRALDAARPHAVLHCAALVNPDLCERERALATRLNAEVPGRLARRCARLGLRLVSLSTDLVFGGSRARWSESDAADPILHYGRTKLAGEQAVAAELPAAAIARVPLVYGRGYGPRGSASETIAWSLRAGRPVRLYVDQYRTAVDAESLAPALRTLLLGEQAGLFHLGGPERLSRYELGRAVARLFDLDATLIEPAPQPPKPAAGDAPRPADVSLDSSRARAELGFSPRALEEALRDGRLQPPLL